MGIRQSIADWLTPKAAIIPLPDYGIPDRPLDKTFDDGDLLSTYQDDPWPYICAAKIGENAALAPLRVGTVTGDDEFKPVPETHPLQQLFDHPRAGQDGAEFVDLLMVYMELVGHVPIEVVRPKTMPSGRLRSINRKGFELNLLDPSSWRIIPASDGTVQGYAYLAGGPNGADLRWTPEQMTYLRWPNPRSRYYGQGRLAAVRQSVMAEEYAAIRDKRLEQRLGVPPGILSSEQPLGEEQAKELQRRWERAVGGYGNAGKIAVLGSKTTYQQLTMSMRDAQWVEQRRWRVQEICGAFGVPLVLVLMSEATFANAEEARAEFWEGTLQPRMDRVAAMLTDRIIPMVSPGETLVVRFDYSSIKALGENALEACQRAGAMVQTGAVTTAEVRKVMGLPPFGDERDEQVLIPSALGTQDDRDAQRAAQAEALRRFSETRQQPEAEEEEKPPAKAMTAKAYDGRRNTDLAPVIEGLSRDLAAYFAALRGALKGLQRGKADPDWDEDFITHRVAEIVSASRWTKRLIRILRAPLEVALSLGFGGAAASIGIQPSLSVATSPAVLAAVLDRVDKLPDMINATTLDALKAAIADSWAAGEKYGALQDRIGTLFEGYETWRVDRIARTETNLAYGAGEAAQWKDAGVEYVDIEDGDGCPVCAAINGQRWTVEEYAANIIEHPNCVRTAIPVTEHMGMGSEVAEELAKMRGEIDHLHRPVVINVGEKAIQPPDEEVHQHLMALAERMADQTKAVKALADRPVEVHVEPPPPAQVVVEPPKPVRKRVKRDTAGRITEVIEEPIDG